MEKQRVKIKNAVITGEYMRGEVIDHPNFKEGTKVQTSRIVNVISGDVTFVETLNTIYELI